MVKKANSLQMGLSPNHRKLFLAAGMLVLLAGTTMLRGSTHEVLGPLSVLLGLFWICMGALDTEHR